MKYERLWSLKVEGMERGTLKRKNAVSKRFENVEGWNELMKVECEVEVEVHKCRLSFVITSSCLLMTEIAR